MVGRDGRWGGVGGPGLGGSLRPKASASYLAHLPPGLGLHHLRRPSCRPSSLPESWQRRGLEAAAPLGCAVGGGQGQALCAALCPLPARGMPGVFLPAPTPRARAPPSGRRVALGAAGHRGWRRGPLLTVRPAPRPGTAESGGGNTGVTGAPAEPGVSVPQHPLLCSVQGAWAPQASARLVLWWPLWSDQLL